MAKDKCIEEVIRASNGYFSKEDVTDIAKEIEVEVKKLEKSGMSMTESRQELLINKFKQIKMDELNVKRQKLIDTRVKSRLKISIDDLVENQKIPLTTAIRSIFVGSSKFRQGLDQSYEGLKQLFLRDLNNRFDNPKMGGEEGLYDWVQDPNNSKVFAQEVEAYNSKDKSDVGASGNKKAIKAAKIWADLLEEHRIKQNRLGANIGKVAGYIAKTIHSRYKLSKAGFDKWYSFIEGKLDEKTFDNVTDKKDFLFKIYDNLKTGVHVKEIDDNTEIFSLKKPGKLANRLSQGRVLHWKKGAWIEYIEEFGDYNLPETLIRTTEGWARNESKLQMFGTNPRAMAQTIVDEYKAKYKDDKLSLEQGPIVKYYRQVMGDNDNPANPTYAKWGTLTRLVQSLSKLGGAGLAAFSDIPINISNVKYQGYNTLEATEKVLTGYIKGFDKDILKRIYIDLNQNYTRLTQEDIVTGAMGKLSNVYFRFNGLTGITRRGEETSHYILATDLGSASNKRFNQLSDNQKLSFKQNGIDENYWEIIRKATDTVTDANIKMVFGDRLKNTSDAEIKSIFKLPENKSTTRRIAEIRDNAERKLAAYMVDRTAHGVIRPTAKEKALTNFGTQAGTGLGEVVRSLMQFKSFPITILNKVWGRDLYSRETPEILSLVSTATAMTLTGYMVMSIKDAIKGNTPRPITVDTFRDAMIQGGAMGLLADITLQEHKRYFGGLIGGMAGPTAGTIEDIYQLVASGYEGDAGDIAQKKASQLFNLTLDHAPFSNLIYTRPVLNYLMVYQMQELMNPGYLGRMENRLSENDQDRIHDYTPY